MKEIPLTKGQSALIDDADFEWISQWKWCASKAHSGYYAMRAERSFGGKYKFVYMHRMINGTPAGVATDHIDGDGLNNTRANLRDATNQQNAANGRRHKDGSSRFKGVSRNPKPGPLNPKPWIAHIGVDGAVRHLGTFLNEEDAAAAYASAAKEAFGDFHRPSEEKSP